MNQNDFKTRNPEEVCSKQTCARAKASLLVFNEGQTRDLGLKKT